MQFHICWHRSCLSWRRRSTRTPKSPKVRLAQQFSMGYKQFAIVERNQLIEKHATWKDLFFPDIHRVTGN